jgi:hypothetical protein
MQRVPGCLVHLVTLVIPAFFVILAYAGIQLLSYRHSRVNGNPVFLATSGFWIPTFVGMTSYLGPWLLILSLESNFYHRHLFLLKM